MTNSTIYKQTSDWTETLPLILVFTLQTDVSAKAAGHIAFNKSQLYTSIHLKALQGFLRQPWFMLAGIDEVSG